ncbi:MAG: lysylphosphatidylglycerol synthase transmembrane domain-containing protein [Gemmatimonadota bacterium]
MRDWKAWAGVAISLALLWWLFRGEDLGDIARQVAQADFAFLVLAGALNVTGGLIRAVRWRLLLAALGHDVPFAARWKALNIGFAVTNITVGRLGEIARPFALSRMTPVSTSAGLGTIALERVLDLVALTALLLLTLVAPAFPTDAMVLGRPIGVAVSGVVGLGAAALVAAVLLAVWPSGVRAVVVPVASVLPARLADPLVSALDDFLAGLGLLRDPSAALRALAWSILVWVWMAGSFWAAFAAFGLELGFTAALFTQCVVAVFVAIPAAPGFIGTLQAGVLVAVSGVFGVADAETLSMSLGYHFAGYIPVTALGGYYAWALRIEVSSIRASREGSEDTAGNTGQPAER